MLKKPVCNEKITPGGWFTFTVIHHRNVKAATKFYNTVRSGVVTENHVKNNSSSNNTKHSGLSTFLFHVLCFAEHVFALNATDDFLIKRAQGLPQNMAEEVRYTQEEFVSRLMRYRQLSMAEETLLDYFDELEIHPEHIGTVLKAASLILGHN